MEIQPNIPACLVLDEKWMKVHEERKCKKDAENRNGDIKAFPALVSQYTSNQTYNPLFIIIR